MKNKNCKVSKWMLSQLIGERVSLIVLAVIVCVSSAADIMIAFVLKLFTDAATSASDFSLSNVVVLAAIVLLTVGLTSVISSIIKARIQCRVEIKIRHEIMRHIFEGNFIETQKLHTADTLTKLTDDTSAVAEYYPRFVTDILGGIVEFIFAVVSLYVLNMKVALLITITMPVLIICISFFNSPIGKADEIQKKNEESNRILMQEYLDQTKVIKIFRIQEKCLEKLKTTFKIFFQSRIVFGLWEGVATFLNGLTGDAMLLITLGVGAYFVQKGETSVGSLMAIVQLLNYIFKPFSRVSMAVSQNAQAKTSAERIYTILSLGLEEPKRLMCNQVHEIVLSDIWFAYEDENILQGADAKLELGKSYCIIGENGSGKTTLINLIAGLYYPDKGIIDIKDSNDQNISNALISLVPANPALFSDSIEKNITLFSDEKDDKKFSQITNMLNIDTFALMFSDGYNTKVGQHGDMLSSGQVQRIAIARALYKDSNVIIFDEPTSNLDGDSVTILKEIINRVKNERIVIVVSHDPALIATCDICYRLKSGKLKNTIEE